MKTILSLLLINCVITTAFSSATVRNIRTGEEIYVECSIQKQNGVCRELFFDGSTIKPFHIKTKKYITRLNNISYNNYHKKKEVLFKFTDFCYVEYDDCSLIIWLLPPIVTGITLHAIDLVLIAPIMAIKNFAKNRKYRVSKRIIRRLRRKVARDGVLRLSNKKFDMLRNMISKMSETAN